MKTFDIPLLPINLERNTDEKLNDRDVPGIELEYLWPKYKPRAVFTGAFVAGGTDGIAISWCAEAPHNAYVSTHTKNKENVFEDDCLEVFLQPAGSATYYCWEINPTGACLDYTATPSSVVNTASADKDTSVSTAAEGLPAINFDYKWKSHAVWRYTAEDEFWYLELFIPWSDFGLKGQPAPGTVWHATLNRIDMASKTARKRAPGTGDNPGYQTLLDDAPVPGFHQPAFFAEFTFV